MAFSKGAKKSHPSKLANKKAATAHPVIAGILAATIPTSVDLATWEPARLNQGATGSCTAHSFSGSTSTSCRKAGKPIPFEPSPRETYATTRGLERAASTPAGQPVPLLTDSGAEPADVMNAGSTFGVAPMQGPTPDGRNSDIWSEQDTTAKPANVNNEPDAAQLEQAGTTLVTGEYMITAGASNISDQVAAALAAGFPVYTCFFCDSAFEALTPGQVAQAPDQNDPNGGGHATYLSGYTTNSDGTRTFILSNSWGTSWCDNGRCLVSEAWLAQVWELYVIDVNVKVAS
jgi:Papain family cysteine protease